MACNDQWLTLPSDGTTEIYVMNADGSAVTRLTEDPQGEYQPTWSPDGTKIAFSRTHVYEDSTTSYSTTSYSTTSYSWQEL